MSKKRFEVLAHQSVFPADGQKEKKPHHHNSSQRKAALRNGEAIPLPPPTPKTKSGKPTTRPGLKAARNAASFIRNS